MLELDERSLAAARQYADAHGISIDEAISTLTLIAIDSESDPVIRARRRGFPMKSPRPGYVVTHEMVEQARDEIDY